MWPTSRRRPTSVPRLPAKLVSVFLLFALICSSHAGVTIEDVPGIYRALSNPRGCPASVTIGRIEGIVNATATLSTSSKCATGKILMSEDVSRITGDNSTNFLVQRGVTLVGTIVLANVTKGVSCSPGAIAGTIERESVLNFLRPRSALTYPGQGSIKFRKGEFYVILSSECFYNRPTPATPGTAAPPQQNSTGFVEAQPGEKDAAPRSPNMWVWAGPLIGVGAIALVGLIALLAAKKGKWYALGNNSEISDSAFFGSLSNSPRRPGSMHDALPRENSGIVFEAANPEPEKKRKSLPESPSQ